MADQNVYNIPSFSKMGYDLAQREEAKAQREQSIRDREVSATGIESMWNKAQHQLQGDRLAASQLAVQEWEKASAEYYRTGSDSDRRKMKEAAGLADFLIGAGLGQQQTVNSGLAQARANGFEGYAETEQQMNEKYSQFMSRNQEVKMENGTIMIKEGEQFVPITQSTYYSSDINENNSVLFPKAVKAGKYSMPSAYFSEIKDAKDLATIRKDFEHRVKSDPDFFSDVMTHYSIKDLKVLQGGRGLSRSDINEAVARAEDPEVLQAALDSYFEDIESAYTRKSGDLLSLPNYTEQVNGNDVMMFAFKGLTKGKLKGVGMDAQGNFYVKKSFGDMDKIMPASGGDLAEIQSELGYNVKDAFSTEEEVEQPQQAQQETTEQTSQESLPSVPKPEEAIEPESGFGGLGLDLPNMSEQPTDSKQTGRAAPASSEMILPESYYNNLLQFEGGISSDPQDNAAQAAGNQDAPKDAQGRLQHTNRGVTYEVFKQWAESNNIPKSKYHERFKNLSESDAVSVVNMYTKNAGADQFESPVLKSLFTQNAWGTGKVYAADFKGGRSKEYRALLDWLQGETGLDFKNTSKINPEEAKAIEAVFNKDPEKFINTFIDKKQTHFSSLDDYGRFGKGWINRSEDLRKKMLAELA